MSDNGNGGGANVKTGTSNFYSPQLSTDFLELPQSEREKRELFRFWYNCFVPGTPVTLLDGTTKPIELMKVGDAVPNGFGEPTIVKEVFQQEIEDNIIAMRVEGVPNIIQATGNHPFRVFDGEKTFFKEMKDIVLGDLIISPWRNAQESYASISSIFNSVHGTHHRVKSMETALYKGPIHNIEVEGDGDKKSYIAHGLSTHNTHPIIASAIDFHCFPPGAPVMLPDGTIKEIQSFQVGDDVLNGFGEPTKVVQTFAHDVCAPITRIKVRGVQSGIECTENHPFLVYKSEQVDCKFPVYGLGACKRGSKQLCKQKKCLGPDVDKPSFVFAKDLRVGDYICAPAMVSSLASFNRSQLRLLGYYTAEGSLSRTSTGKLDRVVFTLNSDEYNTVADEISDLFSMEYSRHARKSLRTDSNACSVKCYKKDFAEFCYENVGSGSLNKKLSKKLMDSPREDLLEFLGAYWNGDGSLTKNGYVAVTVSKQLAHQIYAIAMKVGFAPTLHIRKSKPSTGFKYTDLAYEIKIPYRFHHEFSKYANFVNNGYAAASTREYQIRIGNNTLRRIEKVDTVSYDGPVYNIEVEGEGDRKSYVAYGLATHNTDVPMSKIRLSLPKGKDLRRNKQIHHFFMEMVNRVRLFQVLYDMTHEYWLHGNVFPFVEDHDLSDSIPEELLGLIKEEHEEEPDFEGIRKKKVVTKPNPVSETERSKKIRHWVAENYRGWERIQILPPEQVKLEVFQYTHRVKMELIPSEKDRMVVMKAADGMDEEAIKIADDIPDMIKNSLLSGEPIPLNSSPYDDFLCSSFCYHLSHKKSAYDDRGISLLERCLRTLNIQDKLRQAQTSIASRAMTPKRVVWADKMSEMDTEMLRDQVEQALQDPDFSIITNFEVHWDEIGARDRLLDLTSEYENSNKMLYIGLRITESMLTGESTYSGERIHLDVMNTMYLLYRERISEFVEEYLFKPVAEKKGFWEEDEYGNRNLLYPKLQFTRLALRDNSELQDYMFNLYQKGSLPISFILDLINIDPDDSVEQLKLDALTFNDPNFNEFLKRALEKAGDEATEKTDILEKIFKNAGLKYTEKQGDRFGKDEE